MINLNDENYENLLKSDKLLIVDFYAGWCGPCKAIGPILEKLEKEILDCEFAKVDVDEALMVTSKYKIRTIPTILFIRNGDVIDTLIGAHPENKIRDKIIEFNN